MWRNYFNWIQNNFDLQKINEKEFYYKKNGNKVSIDLKENKWKFEGIKSQNNRIWNLNNEENNIVLILCLKLLKAGYSKNNIVLEKKLNGGWLDICLIKDGRPYYMIEVKTPKEIEKYTENTKEKQLFIYLFQEKSVKMGFYYTFDLTSEKGDRFYSVLINDILLKSQNSDDLFDKWNKLFDNTNLLSWTPFDIKITEKKIEDLKEITDKDADILFKQFLTILRVNSVSDKSNSFDKIINLFIAKVYDETWENQPFSVESKEIKHELNGLRFQFLEEVDTLETFMKRISDLYKEGMKEFLGKEVTDYSENEVKKVLFSQKKNPKLSYEILSIIEDLRLKKSNTFAFIEVFDEKTFKENSLIVKEVVNLLSKFKFRCNYKTKSLGDFFEQLLNTSLKQESGQFFTPYPIVDFMINSLPLQEKIKENIQNNKGEIIPLFIDYACGSGHFLISYIDKFQEEINNLNQNNYPARIKEKINIYKNQVFSWVREGVFGLEKDYRLAKTTKISLFLNGDGEANILHTDALNKFSCNEYSSIGNLHSLDSNDNKKESFDFVVSNPPYSVKGYMQNFNKNDIFPGDGTFELIKKFSDKDGSIEIAFVERTWQLLKENGLAFIILPHSFLSVEKYSKSRKWILQRFQILAIFCSGDSTFASTSTSTSIFFMRKKSTSPKLELDYQLLLINSPKMFANSRKVKINEEREFLGYKFSKARGKLGTETLNSDLTVNYSPLIKRMHSDSLQKAESLEKNAQKDLKTEREIIHDKHSRFVILKDIVISGGEKNRYCLFTRYKKPKESGKFFSLKDLEKMGICKVNIQRKRNYEKEKLNLLKYVEITNIQDNKIIGNFKNKDGSRIAEKGDILFPRNASLNWWKKIAKVENNYKVSNAIYVITFTDKKKRDYVYNYLTNNKNEIFENIKSLLDGFKISYSKISEFNLMNNVFFENNE